MKSKDEILAYLKEARKKNIPDAEIYAHLRAEVPASLYRDYQLVGLINSLPSEETRSKFRWHIYTLVFLVVTSWLYQLFDIHDLSWWGLTQMIFSFGFQAVLVYYAARLNWTAHLLLALKFTVLNLPDFPLVVHSIEYIAYFHFVTTMCLSYYILYKAFPGCSFLHKNARIPGENRVVS